MPNKPKRTKVSVEFHPLVTRYLTEIAEDNATSAQKIIRLCVERSLAEVEEFLRNNPDPPDKLNVGYINYIADDEFLERFERGPSSLPPPALLGFLSGSSDEGQTSEEESEETGDESLPTPEPSPPAAPPAAPRRRRSG